MRGASKKIKYKKKCCNGCSFATFTHLRAAWENIEEGTYNGDGDKVYMSEKTNKLLDETRKKATRGEHTHAVVANTHHRYPTCAAHDDANALAPDHDAHDSIHMAATTHAPNEPQVPTRRQQQTRVHPLAS